MRSSHLFLSQLLSTTGRWSKEPRGLGEELTEPVDVFPVIHFWNLHTRLPPGSAIQTDRRLELAKQLIDVALTRPGSVASKICGLNLITVVCSYHGSSSTSVSFLNAKLQSSKIKAWFAVRAVKLRHILVASGACL